MNLERLAARIQGSRGVAHKRDIDAVVSRFGLGHAQAIAVGDDCAAIPDGDGWLLFAIEGFMPEFVHGEPGSQGIAA